MNNTSPCFHGPSCWLCSPGKHRIERKSFAWRLRTVHIIWPELQDGVSKYSAVSATTPNYVPRHSTPYVSDNATLRRTATGRVWWRDPDGYVYWWLPQDSPPGWRAEGNGCHPTLSRKGGSHNEESELVLNTDVDLLPPYTD